MKNKMLNASEKVAKTCKLILECLSANNIPPDIGYIAALEVFIASMRTRGTADQFEEVMLLIIKNEKDAWGDA